MSIQVFNNFNNCFLAGLLPASMDIRFIPVNSKFLELADDENFYKLRNLTDLSTFAKIDHNAANTWDETSYTHADYSLTGTYYDYICRKVENTETTDKPDFINKENFNSFVTTNRISDSDIITKLENYAETGFYYVKTREALFWVANRVNDKTNFNNFINIVLGDDVGDAAADKAFTLPIIGSANRPYQGTFDGMGHKLINVELNANKLANGLIGYLGDKGKLCNLQLGDTTSTTVVFCNKKITLPHLKSSAANINAGVLVGENYGTVSNIAVFGKFIFKNFTPSIYATTNKTENNTELYEKDPYDTSMPYSNVFFNDAFCWNSPFNIVPYMGYFAQGIPYSTTNILKYNLYDETASITKFGVYSIPNASLLSIDWYGKVCEADSHARLNCDDSFKDGTNHDVLDNNCAYFFDAYFNMPSKLQHALRCAYYCSPVIGCNNGNLENIYVSATIEADNSVFVGFIGGICGLQNRGYTKNCVSDLFFNGRLDERKKDDVINSCTEIYAISDVSASTLSYAGDKTFKLYYRTKNANNHRKFPCIVEISSDEFESIDSLIVRAKTWFPQYDDKDNCAKNPSSLSNIELLPCMYEDEPVVFSANKTRYQLYRCALENVAMDFSDHKNGNLHIQFESSDGDVASCYPFTATPKTMKCETIDGTTKYGNAYASCDVTANAKGEWELVAGATQLTFVTAYDVNFSATWDDKGCNCVVLDDISDGDDNIITRSMHANDILTATISNFKVGVAYGKPFTECTNNDLYICNDYNADIKYSTDESLNKAVAKDLYYKYPLGISFENIQSDNLGLTFQEYKVKAISGVANARKGIVLEQLTLSNGTTINVAANYTAQTTRDEVKKAIDKNMELFFNTSLSAMLFTSVEDKYSNNIRTGNAKYATLSKLNLYDKLEVSSYTINSGNLKVRGTQLLGSIDKSVYTSSHFQPLSYYETDVKNNTQTLVDAAANAAVIYSCRYGDAVSKDFDNTDYKAIQNNYFAVNDASKSNMTAVAGVVAAFSSVNYIKKSIYNVGAYAGMLTVSDGFTIENTSAAYCCDKQNYRDDTPQNPNINHFCRYGGLAAKAEIQTCNISNTVDLIDGSFEPNKTHTFSHVVSAKNCVFYNNYMPDDRASDVISNALIAEINYLRLPIPSIYQFENGLDRDSKGKNYKVGIWTSDVPYHAHPVTINLWNNSVGSAAWVPNHDGDSNPHRNSDYPDKVTVQFASEHQNVKELFRFESCKIGINGLQNAAITTIASAYIGANHAVNLIPGVYINDNCGDHEQDWCRDKKYFKSYIKVMAMHDYMAGDMILTARAANDTEKTNGLTSIVSMTYPTNHFGRIKAQSDELIAADVTAVNFNTTGLSVIGSKQIPASGNIVSIKPLTLEDSYFTYTYDASATQQNAYIQLDEPVKKLNYTKNISVTDIESDLLNIQTTIIGLFNILAKGYDDTDVAANTVIKQSTIQTVTLTCGDKSQTFDHASTIGLKLITDVINNADSCELTIEWQDTTVNEDASTKTAADKFLLESKKSELDNFASTNLYMFKTLETNYAQDSFRLLLTISNAASEFIKHAYVFEDVLNTENESQDLASEYFGNTIHIGVKYKPAYIRNAIIDNTTAHTFTYTGAAFKDLAGFLLVDTDTKNLVAYINSNDSETEISNGCWSMKFDQATKDSNNNFPYESSAVLINITTDNE